VTGIRYNTHTHSPGWGPLKQIFRDHGDEFLRLSKDQRFPEKHLIGAAMWKWLCDSGRIDPQLKALAEEVHFRPTKEKSGLPLWRLAFKDILRNTPGVDALFIGKRVGPTPRYARLSAMGVVPADPSRYVASSEELFIAERPVSGPPVRSAYAAREEWELGSGGEQWVYVYAFQRELDLFERNGIEPLLKIGCTRQHYSARIASQAGGTAGHSPVKCLFAYRVVDAQQLEAAVHKVLRVQGRHVKDAPGLEWFEIRPEQAHTLITTVAGQSAHRVS
jgi:hypothetical protein